MHSFDFRKVTIAKYCKLRFYLEFKILILNILNYSLDMYHDMVLRACFEKYFDHKANDLKNCNSDFLMLFKGFHFDQFLIKTF